MFAAVLVSAALLAVGVSSASALSLGVMWSNPDRSLEEMGRISHLGASVFHTPIDQHASWAEDDQLFQVAWEHGITILPYLNRNTAQGNRFLLSSDPDWGPWTSWAREMVERYGVNGSFWTGKANPRPVMAWEVWNEPNLADNNPILTEAQCKALSLPYQAEAGTCVQAQHYGAFLQHTSEAIQAGSVSKTAHGTEVLFGGIYMPAGEILGEFLSKAAAVSGTGAFTGLAIHPYSLVNGISELESRVNEARAALTGVAGGSKSLWITELGWPVGGSAHFPSGGAPVTEAQQASLLTAAFNWIKGAAVTDNIQLVDWYNIRDSHHPENAWDDWCGLRAEDGSYRPSWFAFEAEAGRPSWPVAPGVETLGATGITEREATLRGSVNPKGLPATYRFEYGLTTSYGSSIPVPSGGAGEGEVPLPVSATLTDLEPGATYHYRVVAGNEVGPNTAGPDRTFTTPSGPPAEIFDGGGNMFVVTQGESHSLNVTTRYADGTWHGPYQEGGVGSTVSSPAAIFDNGGNLFVAAQGPEHSLKITTRYVDGTWHGPDQEGPSGYTYSAPAEAFDNGGNLFVLMQGPEHSLYVITRYADGTWHGPDQEGPTGIAYSAPAAIFDNGGNMFVAMQGPEHSLEVMTRYADGTWHGPYQEGPAGSTYSRPAWATDGYNLFAAAQGPEHSLKVTTRHGDGTWAGPEVEGPAGNVYSAPSWGYDGYNLFVATQGPENSLKITTRTGDGTWHGADQEGPSGIAYSASAWAFDGYNFFVATQGAGSSLNVMTRLGNGTWSGPYQAAGPGTTH